MIMNNFKGKDGNGYQPVNILNSNAVPKWAKDEIINSWNKAKVSGGQSEAYKILEDMVRKVVYDNPPVNP